MALPLDGSDLAVYSVGGNDLKARLKTWSILADNDFGDAGGIGDRWDLNKIVKQGQSHDFVVFQDDTDGDAATNLSITAYTIGTVNYLDALQGGSISVTTRTKDVSSIAAAYKVPAARRTAVEVTTDLMVFSTADLQNLVMSGNEASMRVTVLVTWGTTTFNCPMVLKSSKVSGGREETTMENVSMSLYGTPTGPSDSSLLGNVLLGSSAVALNLGTGGDTYATSGGQFGIITKLTTTFAGSTVLEQTGTIEIQGALAVA